MRLVSHCLYGFLASKTRRTSTPGVIRYVIVNRVDSRASPPKSRIDAYIAILVVALVQGGEEHQVTPVKDFDNCAMLL